MIRRRLSALALGCALAASAGRSRADDSERGRPAPQGPCVATRTEAIYRNYGYDHLVHLDNRCKKPMRCVVSTNAAPEPTQVDLAIDEKRTLTVFRGSPANEVNATVKCEERK